MNNEKHKLRTHIEHEFRTLAAFARVAGIDYSELVNYLRSNAKDSDLEAKADLALQVGLVAPKLDELRQKVFRAYPPGQGGGIGAFCEAHGFFNYQFVCRVLRGRVKNWQRSNVRDLVRAINKL